MNTRYSPALNFLRGGSGPPPCNKPTRNGVNIFFVRARLISRLMFCRLDLSARSDGESLFITERNISSTLLDVNILLNVPSPESLRIVILSFIIDSEKTSMYLCTSTGVNFLASERSTSKNENTYLARFLPELFLPTIESITRPILNFLYSI